MTNRNAVDADECAKLVKRSMDNFNCREKYLIEHNLSERCICARFARYLEDELHRNGLRDYVVDVEYNSNAGDSSGNPKSLPAKRMGACKRIVVDLIAHKRGAGSDHNLICIEMKKLTNQKNLESDEERLRRFTNPYGDFCYVSGFMIIIDNNPERHNYQLEISSKYPEA